ncbi:JmjC domain-containing protein [Glaciecola petra]|uniref:Cupin domain-containing protein n=1 Tax=Glaciecola petra TaxID=3075602 RepID=A0ABU2ZLV3_9ALTE|nr:cupin domain-containing protein [Aestuariibacter sp. P117]MDT0593319.1 cupin domain-containing protein [Aestuariibacter sp. P117]
MDLFQWTDLNDFLSNSRPKDRSINLVGGGKKTPFLSHSVLREQIISGQTLEIDNLQEVDPAIRGFCDSCSDDFNTEVNINAYVSHPSAQGFNLHYDFQDVFILQTEGIKRWYIYEPSELWPCEEKLFEATESGNASPYLDIELKPGDVLYIPRGHWHKAIAVEPCIHLTVTVPYTSGADVLTHLIQQLSKTHPILRKDLPIHSIRGLGGSLSEHRLDKQLDEIADKLLEVIADRNQLKQFVYQHAIQNSPISKEIEMPTLAIRGQDFNAQTRFKRNANQACMLNQLGEKKIELLSAGQTFQFEDMPISIINNLVADNTALCGESLIKRAATEGYSLDWQDIEKVILVLINHGVLVFLD